MFLDGEPDDALLEFVAEHDVAGRRVELREELLLSLLPLLPQLRRVVVLRRRHHLVLRPRRPARLLLLRRVAVEYPSVFGTDFFADKV